MMTDNLLTKQTSSTTMTTPPFFLLLPQFVSSVVSEKSNSPHKFKVVHYLVSLTLFLFRLILSLLPSLSSHDHTTTTANTSPYLYRRQGDSDSGLARALSQILSTMLDLPVTSRKYETVRCLADKIIDENLEEGSEPVLQVNRRVLVAAFAATLGRLEEVMMDEERVRVRVAAAAAGNGFMDYHPGLSWVWNAAKSRVIGLVDDVEGVRPHRIIGGGDGSSTEKLAAEVLWLAQKLVVCGYGEEAVSMWGDASDLASLALSAEPRVQSTLLKTSAFLFMQAKELGSTGTKEEDETQREEQIQRRKRLLISWLPLLCCASNGTDSPVLSNMVKKEIESVLENIIEMLKHDDEQEQVLSLWLHHFTACPSSDWPNLQACYNKWCRTSRKRLAAQ